MHKQNKNNNPQYVLIAVALVAVTISYTYFKNVQLNHQQLVKQNTQFEKKQNHSKDAKQNKDISPEPKRSIASIPNGSSVIKKYQNRKIVGSFNVKKDFPISNKIDINWKKKAVKKLTSFLSDDTKLKVELVKPAIFVKHNIGRYVEHVKIILRKDSGLVSAYEAYVDSQSGNVIRTWNRTKIERNPATKVSAEGKGVYSLPLNKDEN